MYKNILVPVDLRNTETAAGALSVARHMGELMGAQLTLMSVVDPRPGDGEAALKEAGAAMEALLEDQRRGGHQVEGMVREGPSICGGILKAADEIDADLIVMASHDPLREPRHLIGSNACHVVTHTPRSVLVVR